MADTQFDTIALKIQPAGTLHLPWPDVDRVIILINNQDILDIIRNEERKLSKQGKIQSTLVGAYHHLPPSELYEYLVKAEESKGKEEADILCCSCDEVGCDSISTKILKMEDSVIWNDICNNHRAIKHFSLSFKFKLENYKNFISELKKHIK